MKLWAMRLASSFVMRFMTARRPGLRVPREVARDSGMKSPTIPI
jgi:hypothetical protein